MCFLHINSLTAQSRVFNVTKILNELDPDKERKHLSGWIFRNVLHVGAVVFMYEIQIQTHIYSSACGLVTWPKANIYFKNCCRDCGHAREQSEMHACGRVTEGSSRKRGEAGK